MIYVAASLGGIRSNDLAKIAITTSMSNRVEVDGRIEKFGYEISRVSKNSAQLRARFIDMGGRIFQHKSLGKTCLLKSVLFMHRHPSELKRPHPQLRFLE